MKDKNIKIEVGLILFLFFISYLLYYSKAPIIITFLSFMLSIIKAASLLGFATEEVAAHYGGNIGGILNATFGNLAELIIGFFAIKEGLVEIVKASITGSIIGNALFVFGISIIAGAIKRKELVINEKEVEVNSTMMLIAVFLFLFPSLLFIFHEESFEYEISLITSFFLILLYFASIVFSFITHKEWFITSSEKPNLSKKTSMMLMIFSVVVIVILSEAFASMLENVGKELNLNELFIGSIIVGIAGNAAEHLGAIGFAKKNKMSLVVNTTIGSSIQIAMFVVPFLVFLSFLIGNPMSLSFLPIEIIAILSSTFLLNEVYRDKKVNWLEGMELVILYLVIATVFYFYTA